MLFLYMNPYPIISHNMGQYRQYRQLTLAEVQFLHVHLLSSKSVSDFTELHLLQFLVKTLVLRLELESELELEL